MKIEFINNSSVSIPKKYLQQSLKIFLKLLVKKRKDIDFKNLELSLVFLDPLAAKKINKKYRNKNYATDVLSFTSMPPALGELIMCPQVLKEQAKEQKHSFRTEVLYMTIHGILHLLGYEHENDAQKAKEMLSLQEELFTKTLQKLVFLK
ncbi:MAG: rRNA maturation RNase YbeY [Bdellovibrionales bacterium]|nr:rRNA maturation RNase YbeY [Bdellovibrionales bacterium]